MRRHLVVCLFCIVLGVFPALASDPANETLSTLANNPLPERDATDLAVRFRGADPSTFTIAPRPAYQVGAVETFTMAGSEGRATRQLEMELAAATSEVYLWMERDMNYQASQMDYLAQTLTDTILPRVRSIFGVETPIASDHHIYVFIVRDAGEGIAGFFNDTDRYPNELFPTSNEVNSFVMAISPQNTAFFLSTLAHEFQHLVQAGLDDSEETWFVEGMAELGSWLAIPEMFSGVGRQGSYITSGTDKQLNSWSRGDASPQDYYAAASLFLSYITQRYGEGWITLVATEPNDGMLGIENALAAYGALDPATGQIVTANDVFADFVVTNFLNNPTVGDGRYAYRLSGLDMRANPDLLVYDYSQPLDWAAAQVNQYGTTYLTFANPTNSLLRLQVDFSGSETVNLLPTQPRSGEYFLWSQRGNQTNARAVGRFDLRNVPSATLNFWTWYDMEQFWDYGYISASIDGGATWQLITTAHDMTVENPYDRAFGAGFTGVPGGGTARPAPYIGFSFEDSALLVQEVQPNAPGAAAGLQNGDMLIAINGAALTADNFFTVLDQYAAGDTVILTVQRGGGSAVDLTITLGAHPSRSIEAIPQWVQETIDLTPYVGHEVLLSFDYVTDQATSYDGWLLDDVSIPEIGFFDDFEGENPAWQKQGWVRIQNEMPQDYLIQLIHTGANTTVSRLMAVQDPNSGTWTLDLGVNEQATLAISGIAEVTTLPATYTLKVAPVP